MSNPEQDTADSGDIQNEQPDEEPTREQLQEPSAEKDPGDEPTAPADRDAEPSHEAVGIGVIDAPQADPEAV